MFSERAPAVAAIAILVLPLALVAAEPPGANVLFLPDDPIWRDLDEESTARPDSSEASSDLMEALSKTLVRPRSAGASSAEYARNINTLGQVPDSSWFTSRHGRRRMSAEELARGPDRNGPPAGNSFEVLSGVGEGRTAKFMIRDRTGRKFIVKLENPEYPELMSAAEVICTKFFYSFGYNVPENYIVTFHPEQLRFESGDKLAPSIHERLAESPRTADGRIRAVASLLLSGDPIGPFSYEGVREDDPNDIFPHQHRRELRALRVFGAWLNHTDVKSGNSLDTFMAKDGDAGFVRHHLIDFGSCLGSAADGAKDPLTGYEYYLEPVQVLKSALTMGAWLRPYVALDYPDYPAVGHIDADYFEPWRWKPPVPNAALNLMDAADAFWGASIVARYTESDIRTLVAEGRITDREAEEHLVELLLSRQRKILAYWLTLTNPLDDFEVQVGSGATELTFANAAVRAGVAELPLRYRYRWFRLDNHGGERIAADTERAVHSEPGARAAVPLPSGIWGPEDDFGFRYAVIEIETDHPKYLNWMKAVTVTLRNRGEIEIVGVERPNLIPEADARLVSSPQPR
jgi:hypothetical protein